MLAIKCKKPVRQHRLHPPCSFHCEEPPLFFEECVFRSIVASAFQIIFRVKMHANDFFLFFKIIFDISTSKRSKTYKQYSILIKKIQNF